MKTIFAAILLAGVLSSCETYPGKPASTYNKDTKPWAPNAESDTDKPSGELLLGAPQPARR
jgi:hypothetical protein